MNLQDAISTFRKKVGNVSQDDFSDEEVTRLLNAAYREIGMKYPFRETRCWTSFQTVQSVSRYNLPECLDSVILFWNTTSGWKLKKRGPRYVASINTNFAVQSAPTDYILGTKWVQLDPVPDATIYTISLHYRTSLKLLVSGQEEFVFPVGWHDGIVYKARFLYFDERGDAAKAANANNMFKDWVSDMPSEIDMEKDDLQDVGVIIPTLGGEIMTPRIQESFDFDDDNLVGP